MNKQEFLAALRYALQGLPREDIEKTADYYSEMIDDRVEDGLSEEEAVAAVGSVDDIVRQTASEIPLPTLMQRKLRPKRSLAGWEIALLILGAPVWLPLLIAAGAVVLSVLIVLWAVVISLYAVALSLAVAGIGAVVAVFLPAGSGVSPLLGIGAGLLLAGLGILLFVAMISASKALVRGFKGAVLSAKTNMIRKGEN